jgi:hypothetical protein
VPALKIEAGEDTEQLLQFILGQVDDATLDQIDIQRDLVKSAGFASEPVTASVAIVLGTAVVSSVVRLIERWIESRRQLEEMKIVAIGFDKSDEAGKNLTQLAKTHAQVSLKYELAKESWREKK